jgi:hypothetical protein
MKNVFLGVGFIVAAVIAQATVIDPGAMVAPNAIATAVGAGSTSLITVSGNYVFNAIPADISGSYIETAFADTTNPFNSISGVYDTTLVLKITVGPGTATVERATLGYFGGFETSVSYLTGSSAAPTGATRDVIGSVIGYDFTGLQAGNVETLVVYTNSVGATPGGVVSIQDGTAGYNVGISPSPEPASLALSGSGLAIMCLLYFRFRRKVSMGLN